MKKTPYLLVCIAMLFFVLNGCKKGEGGLQKPNQSALEIRINELIQEGYELRTDSKSYSPNILVFELNGKVIFLNKKAYNSLKENYKRSVTATSVKYLMTNESIQSGVMQTEAPDHINDLDHDQIAFNADGPGMLEVNVDNNPIYLTPLFPSSPGNFWVMARDSHYVTVTFDTGSDGILAKEQINNAIDADPVDCFTLQ